MINFRRFGVILVASLIVLGTLLPAGAQGDDTPLLLMLTSPDTQRPVQFQRIAPGTLPTPVNFTGQLVINAETDPADPIIYVAIPNTGWSIGVIGLIGPALDPAERYVALEVDAAGMPRAEGLGFELTYDDTLGETGGFMLRVVLAQMRTFGIFHVIDGAGLDFAGTTHKIYRVPITAEPLAVTVEPEPVFAPFVLDCHIIANVPSPTGSTPGPLSEVQSASGEWGACGSCDTCGHHSSECVLDPDGACAWDPGACRPSTCEPDGSIHCVTEEPACAQDTDVFEMLETCYDSCGQVVSVTGGACLWFSE